MKQWTDWLTRSMVFNGDSQNIVSVLRVERQAAERLCEEGYA